MNSFQKTIKTRDCVQPTVMLIIFWKIFNYGFELLLLLSGRISCLKWLLNFRDKLRRDKMNKSKYYGIFINILNGTKYLLLHSVKHKFSTFLGKKHFFKIYCIFLIKSSCWVIIVSNTGLEFKPQLVFFIKLKELIVKIIYSFYFNLRLWFSTKRIRKTSNLKKLFKIKFFIEL